MEEKNNTNQKENMLEINKKYFDKSTKDKIFVDLLELKELYNNLNKEKSILLKQRNDFDGDLRIKNNFIEEKNSLIEQKDNEINSLLNELKVSDERMIQLNKLINEFRTIIFELIKKR